MKVSLDTNVLISGLLSPDGVPGQVVLLVAQGVLQVCYDNRILTEYDDVLRRPKFGLEESVITRILEQVQAEGIALQCEPLAVTLPDPDDAMFLEAAIAGDAFCLVTGNTKHFPEDLRQGVRVLTPREFIESLP